MGLPFASRAVTVMVDVPLPAVIGDVAVTVDRAEDTKPALTTTVVVCVIATALIVADTVFDPAAVEPRLPVASPLASVVPIAAVIGDVALTVERAAETVPGFTTTVAICVMATVLIVAETVFVPAAVELS